MAAYDYSRYINVFPHNFNSRSVGIEKVLTRTNLEIMRIKKVSMRALIKCAAIVRRETEHGAVLTPRDTGNLVHSWFVVTAKGMPVGRGAKFKVKGKKGANMDTDHIAAMSEAQNAAKGLDTGGKNFLIMGYSANYAIYVHEDWGGKKEKKWTKARSGPKWFETALNAMRVRMLTIIRREVLIPK